MTLGIIVGFVVFGIFAINVKKYVEFMNMDYDTYKEFAVYSILQLYIHLIFSSVLENYTLKIKKKLANKYCMRFNLLNFVILILSSIILKDKIQIVVTTLIAILIYTAYVTVKQYKKFKFQINILNCCKYESVEICNNTLFFLIFLFGLSNALKFGEKIYAGIKFCGINNRYTMGFI